MAWWGRNKDEVPQQDDPEQLSPELIARYNEVLLDGLSDGDMMNRVKNDQKRNPQGRDPREYLTVEEVLRLQKEVEKGI